MAGIVRLLLILLLGATLMASPALAQTADSPAPASASTAEPEFLKTFPQPPDQPASLLAPAPPLGPPPPDLERPYFQQDPLLDPPQLGEIGWFADVQIGIFAPHLVNEQSLPVSLPATPTPTNNVPGIPPGVTTSAGQNFISPPTASSPMSFTVGVNPARLNWTVAPRFEVGYRLPSGFGGISVAYQFLSARGSQQEIGADGPATLSSVLEYNIGDLDWVSHEYTPFGIWQMRLHLGIRYLNAYWNSQASESFAEAAAGSTVSFQATTNNVWTIGPHAGVDLRRPLNFWGLEALGFLDLSEGWGRIRQGYFVSTTSGANGLPQSGVEHISTSDAVPVLMGRLGVNWNPPAYPNVNVFAGYQLDYFWNTGRMGNFTEFGYFFASGILLRGEWNF